MVKVYSGVEQTYSRRFWLRPNETTFEIPYCGDFRCSIEPDKLQVQRRCATQLRNRIQKLCRARHVLHGGTGKQHCSVGE